MRRFSGWEAAVSEPVREHDRVDFEHLRSKQWRAFLWGVGAADPEGFTLDVIRSAPQQVLQYHVKDRLADGDTGDLGAGSIDFQRIFKAHRVREYIVENDNPDVSPLRTAEVGYAYLRGQKCGR
jgi:hypothetical protein